MSAVAEKSRVSVLLADYAAVDAAGKVNALGLGWMFAGLNPQTGMTPAQTVVAMLDSPPELYGHEFSVTLTLFSDNGRPVEIPGPTGAPQALRLAHSTSVEEPSMPPGVNAPRGKLWAHTQVVLNLAGGLNLVPGHVYTWRLDIDATHDVRWEASFYVPGARPGPVFGGPANPTHIPGISAD